MNGVKNKNYLIKYDAFDEQGNVIKSGTMRAKNKMSVFDAQCSFEEHLKKKYANFHRLVIHSCTLDDPFNLGQFGDLFGDIFK